MKATEKELFLAAIRLPASGRDEFLARECSDQLLRERILNLLRHHDRMSESFLEMLQPDDATVALRQVGPYRIRRQIGQGGMGVIYLADDELLRRRVAVKILPPFRSSPQAMQRFVNEGRILAALKHESIVPIYQCVQDNDVRAIVMEYVEGETLDVWIQRERSKHELDRASEQVRVKHRQLIPLHRSMVEVFAALADALEHAHRCMVVHRDVKPSNILVGVDNRPRLTDFGIARLMDADTQTATGEVPGTVAYMSPEQVSGGRVDARSDIFSLGVVLYEALTGQRPFQGATIAETLTAIRFKSATPPKALNSAVTRNLDAVCMKLIEKDVEHRYPSAAHVAADFASLLRGEAVLARPLSAARRVIRYVRRHQRMALITLSWAALIAYGAIRWQQWDSARSRMSVLVLPAAMGEAILRPIRGETFEPGSAIRLQGASDRHFVAPGAYRLNVQRSERLLHETTVVLAAGQVSEIRLDGQTARNDADMLLVPAGDYTCGVAGRQGMQAARVVSVEAFYIDLVEVSNAAYREFVIASGRSQPPHWEAFGYDEDLAERPVVGVTWDDANEFARWTGKRLPTPTEWEIAMRAPDGRLLPWGAQHPSERPSVRLYDAERMAAGDLRVAYESYVTFTLPVGDGVSLRSPLGICHGATNVTEFTETVLVGETSQIVIKGGSWTCEPEFFDSAHFRTAPYATISSDGSSAPSWSMAIGFRCARSAR